MRTGAMTPGAETPLDVRILGPVRWYVSGRPLAVGGPLTRAMLAVLVVNRRNAISPPRLANTIWDGDPPPSFRANLHNRIAELRATLQAADVAATAILRTDSSGNYCLDIRDEQCDLGRFEQARTEAMAAFDSGEHEHAAEHFLRALGEWSGAALDGLPMSTFVEAFCAHMDEERQRTLEARLDLEIAAGRGAEVIGELRALTARHPLRETLWAQLITALYESGRDGDALEACRAVRRMLRDQGTNPGNRVTGLEHRILRHEPLPNRGRICLRLNVDTDGSTLLETLGHVLLYVDDGRRFEVTGASMTIGRSADNDIRLEDAKTSRQHASVVLDGAAVRIEDRGSANGVFVNDQRIRGRAALVHGDRIRIGSVTLEVRRPLA
ncbi:BTAD domain-containing putative transcriptional regulator [Nocardia pseudovaccinii]|uniref:BTAD domain-containing putative transcriptional regulator n=1 Tax=Nocardia pseudovaccinii TaxID=189540 RepID=UPI0007A4CCA4|nr:BTAD domain-containing putative transcriptional regulator [Nocardia pseudovaccinii]